MRIQRHSCRLEPFGACSASERHSSTTLRSTGRDRSRRLRTVRVVVNASIEFHPAPLTGRTYRGPYERGCSDAALRSLRVGPQLLLPGAEGGPLAGLHVRRQGRLRRRRASHRRGQSHTGSPKRNPARRSADGRACVWSRPAPPASASRHTDEFAYSLEGRNAHYGIPYNSAAPLCAPGGSSSGTAAAVAGGLVPFGLGTDTGGSIRVPPPTAGWWGYGRRTEVSAPTGSSRCRRASTPSAGWPPMRSSPAGWATSCSRRTPRPAPQRMALIADAEDGRARRRCGRRSCGGARPSPRSLGIRAGVRGAARRRVRHLARDVPHAAVGRGTCRARGVDRGAPRCALPDVEARFDAGARRPRRGPAAGRRTTRDRLARRAARRARRRRRPCC